MIKKNKDKILIGLGILIIFIYYLSLLLNKETTNLDELWNYNIARNIAKGLTPYKDISLITTPLLPILEAAVLKVFSNQLITFRITNAILVTAILFLTYKIFTNLNIKKEISALLVLPLIWLLKEDIFLDYNFFILLIVLIITLLELNKIKHKATLREELIIGLLGGLAICTKQTIGLIIFADILAMPLITNWSKKEIKNVVYRIVGAIIPVTILVIYLLATGAFYDFISYTFLAINTFSNSIPYGNLLRTSEIETQLLAILMPIITIGTFFTLIITRKCWKEKITYKKIKVLFMCSIPLLLIQYPIADRLHFLLSNYLTLVLTLFVIYEVIKRIYYSTKVEIKKYFVIVAKVFCSLCGVTFMIIAIVTNFNNYIKAEKNTQLKYYNNLIVPEYIQNLYAQLKNKENEYEIKGKKVNILDSNAVAVHIPMDKYVKNYDMFNKGNFGKDGEEGLIKQIRESDNQIYLVKKNQFQKNWQNPTKVTDYIENNLKKIDEVDIYDIYEK